MTDHIPSRRIMRQRETRRAERQHDRHVANATLRAAVKAIGAGEASDWNEDGLEGEWASSGEKTGDDE